MKRDRVNAFDVKLVIFLFSSKDYTPEYEEELYHRIAEENKNKVRLEKKLKDEKKAKEVVAIKEKKKNDSREREAEAQRKLETELRHQREESERRALGQVVLSDAAAANNTSLNSSCWKLLTNFQGN